MVNENNVITPVILGGDLGAYSMARSFAEGLGVFSYVFARDRLAICETSSFINLTVVKNLDDPNVAVSVLIDFAKEHTNEALMLIPTADWYMEMLQYSRETLSKYYNFSIPDFEIWRAFTEKSSFYEILSANGVSYPKTVSFSGVEIEKIKKSEFVLKPPYVLKPSDSALYWKNSFEGMQKVYFPYSKEDVCLISEKIFASGYEGKIIVQERLLDTDDEGFVSEPRAMVLTTFSDHSGRVVRAALGEILLEEDAPTARGNYSAIVTAPLNDFCQKLIGLLEKYRYHGIANFDILEVGGKYFCLELNARSGRSSDYVRAAGINLANALVKDALGIRMEKIFNYDSILWSAVPLNCLYKRPRDKTLLCRAESLIAEGMYSSPFDSELDRGFLRRIYVMIHLRRQAKLYTKYSREELNCFSAKY